MTRRTRLNILTTGTYMISVTIHNNLIGVVVIVVIVVIMVAR